MSDKRASGALRGSRSKVANCSIRAKALLDERHA